MAQDNKMRDALRFAKFRQEVREEDLDNTSSHIQNTGLRLYDAVRGTVLYFPRPRPAGNYKRKLKNYRYETVVQPTREVFTGLPNQC
jgi:hypothetical protein